MSSFHAAVRMVTRRLVAFAWSQLRIKIRTGLGRRSLALVSDTGSGQVVIVYLWSDS
jgi:hypothetical protein